MYNQNQNQSQNQSSGKIEVPESRAALDNMKYEIAGELGINLKQGYNGDLPSVRPVPSAATWSSA